MLECPVWYECHWSYGWYVSLTANAIIAIAYLAIAALILRGLYRTRQLGKNPLGRGTGAIFFTCGVGHAILALHLALPWIGIEVVSGTALRVASNEWHMFLWPPITSAAALTYWSLRSRFPAMVRGAAMFEDIEQRRRQALEIHDNVVQSIAQAKFSLETGRHDEAHEALEESLEASKRIITDLLGSNGGEPIKPGDLRRRQAALSEAVEDAPTEEGA